MTLNRSELKDRMMGVAYPISLVRQASREIDLFVSSGNRDFLVEAIHQIRCAADELERTDATLEKINE